MELAGLHPYPESWYALGTSDELPVGGVLSRRLAGQEVVLFRGDSGEARALDAFCPHLGAHLGKASEVVGDTLRCAFHGFQFDKGGKCVRTGYDTKPPPSCRMKSWPVMESQGVIFVYYGETHPTPEWSIPELDNEGWLPPRFATYHIDGHPQDIQENSVDIGHLTWIHKYEGVAETASLETEGPNLRVSYRFTRLEGILGEKAPIETHFSAEEHGLGFAAVDVQVKTYGLHLRVFIMPTPTDPGKLALRVGMSLHEDIDGRRIHPLLAFVPKRLLQPIIFHSSFKGFLHDVGLDFEIWKHKSYVHRPKLAAGDGPIGAYRRWAKQFYPPVARKVVPPRASSAQSFAS